MGYYEHGEMMGRMSGFGGMGWIGIIWLMIMLLIIVGVIFLIISIIKNNNKRRDWTPSNSALNILKERFARGEIDEDEYMRRKEVLEQENKQ